MGGDDSDHPARGRRFSGDDLHLLILTVLADGPRHGYELIKVLAERSSGAYSPSPGMIYPTLALLEDLGHAVVQAEGTRKLYSISDAGRAHLETQRPRVDLVKARLGMLARKMDVMRRALAGEPQDEGGGAWLPEFIEARRALKHALLARHDASADEQRRIVAILRRALAEIEGDAGVVA